MWPLFPLRVVAQSQRGLCWRLAACPPQPTRTNLRPRGRFWVVRSPGKTIAIECSTQYRGDPLVGAVWGSQWWARASFQRNALLSKGWGLRSWEEALILGPTLSLTQHWGHLGSFWSITRTPSSFPAAKCYRLFRNSHGNLTVPEKAILTARGNFSIYFQMMTKRVWAEACGLQKQGQVSIGIRSCISNTTPARPTSTACLQTRTPLHILLLINGDRARVITLHSVWIFSWRRSGRHLLKVTAQK